jgi:hypothetical protein
MGVLAGEMSDAKVLVAVYAHSGDAVNGKHDKIRQTWGQHLSPWDLRFMIGHRDAPRWRQASDEILLPANRDCGEDWKLWNLYFQELTIEIFRWSLNQGYDFTFLCSNDTFVVPSKLKATDFEKYDYSGIFYPFSNRAPLGETFDEPFFKRPAYAGADAGIGWFTSRKAAELIANSNPSDYFGAGDQYTGQVLGPHIKSGNIAARALGNFHKIAAWHYREDERVAQGLLPSAYLETSFWMRDMYQKYGA